jgi:hypothetical protein
MWKTSGGRWWIALLLLSAVVWAVTSQPTGVGPKCPQAAEVRRAGSPGHFKSGGERSVIVLQEIATTLKKMDERLERIEKAVVELNERNRRATP